MIEFKRYTARVSDKNGRKLYESPPFTTRAAAVDAAFRSRPKARLCSSCYGAGLDIQWHNRLDWLGENQ
jgi:hypothetical protein